MKTLFILNAPLYGSERSTLNEQAEWTAAANKIFDF